MIWGFLPNLYIDKLQWNGGRTIMRVTFLDGSWMRLQLRPRSKRLVDGRVYAVHWS